MDKSLDDLIASGGSSRGGFGGRGRGGPRRGAPSRRAFDAKEQRVQLRMSAPVARRGGRGVRAPHNNLPVI
jgi:hypothetical protein